MTRRKNNSINKPSSTKSLKIIQRNFSFDNHLLELIKKQTRFEEVKSIIAKGKLFNVTDKKKDSLLHYAANFGNVEVAKYLIDSGSKFDAQNSCKTTPLMSAYENYSTGGRVGELLVDAGASIYVKNEMGDTVLTKILYDEGEFKKTNGNFFLKVLLIDCLYNRKKIVQKLFDARWCLPKVILLGDSEVTKIFVDSRIFGSIKINLSRSKNFPFDTPLHIAVRNIDEENVKLLLKYGASINSKNQTKRTVLSYIYDEDASDFVIDNRNQSDDKTEPQQCIERLLILKMLVARTSKKDIGKHDVSNILQFGNELAIKVLFQSSINPMYTIDSEKSRALHNLARNRNPGAIEVLRCYKFDANARDSNGKTLLMTAIVSGNVGAVNFFIKKGADINAVSARGYTALHCAMSVKPNMYELVKECVQIVLERGANVHIDITDVDPGLTIFHEILEHQTFAIGELILAHLALQEAKGIFITELIRGEIDSNDRFKNYFELCKQQLMIEIYESITLFDLLTASSNNLAALFRKGQFILKFRNIRNLLRNNYYYYSLMQARESQGKCFIDLQTLAGPTLGSLININYPFFGHILDNITIFVKESDLINLINLKI